MTFRLRAETGDLTQFTSAADMFEHVLASMDDGEVLELTRGRRLPATLPLNARDSRGSGFPGPAPAQPE